MRQDGFYDYYELLGISWTAPRQEVLAAYNKMRALYGDPTSSAAEYFSAQELAELKDILEQGFEVLSHPLKRAAYNESLKKTYPQKYGRIQPLKTHRDNEDASPSAMPVSSFKDMDFDGFFLKQIREQMQVSLEELSDVTRIKPEFLVALEANKYQDLPAAVFVRGFVSQIAKVYGLDEKKVCSAYMNRFKEARGH